MVNSHMTACDCRDFPVNQYTLPQVWEGVKQQVDYAAKQKEVEDFNRDHVWVKRGAAITCTRYASLTLLTHASAGFGIGMLLVISRGFR